MNTERRNDPAMISSGHERNENDFYPTEPWCTKCALRNYHIPKHLVIGEPACGRGHISKVLIEHGYDVVSSDLNETGYGTSGVDFLSLDAPYPVIFTNPPYIDDMAFEFAKHAIELTKPYKGIVAMIMRTDWGSAKGRYPVTKHPSFAMKLELTKRPRWIADTTGSPRHNYSWYFWDWKTVGNDAVIRFDQ
jgi:hypothetical protein